MPICAEREVVGATGFEPATSWSQTKCSSQAELRSERRGLNIVLSDRDAMRNSWLFALAGWCL